MRMRANPGRRRRSTPTRVKVWSGADAGAQGIWDAKGATSSDGSDRTSDLTTRDRERLGLVDDHTYQSP